MNTDEIKRQIENLQLLLEFHSLRFGELSMNEGQHEQHINLILDEIEKLKKLLESEQK